MEVITNFKPEATSSTIKAYTANLYILQKKFDSDNFEFLEDFNKVLNTLEDLSDSTRKNYLNAIIVYLGAIDGDKQLITKYQTVRNELSEKYVAAQESGVISEKQKPNRTTTEEINKMLRTMELDLGGVNESKELRKVYILFSIYAKYPMRNDVSGMIAVKQADYKKMADTSDNILVVGRSDMKFILNNYKTDKVYGQKIIQVEDKELKKQLRKYIKLVGYGLLFTNNDGSPMSRNRITQVFIKNSKQYMGKSVSSTMLRKAYVSGKYAGQHEVYNEMNKDANMMGHSIAVQQKIYNKSS